MPLRYRGTSAHYDPEFETFTYGDPTKYKRGQLLRLMREDVLVFSAGLRPPDQRNGSRLYLIGYFTVESVYIALADDRTCDQLQRAGYDRPRPGREGQFFRPSASSLRGASPSPRLRAPIPVAATAAAAQATATSGTPASSLSGTPAAATAKIDRNPLILELTDEVVWRLLEPFREIDVF